MPEIGDSAIVFENFLKIRRDTVTMPNSVSYDHFVVVTHDTSVVICAQTVDGLWVLTEEYRHPTGRYILGLPGGYLEKGEDPSLGGRRELQEETGYDAELITYLGAAYPYAGVSGQKAHFILATNAYQRSIPTPEPTELLRTVLMSTEEIHAHIRAGLPLDANVCTALYLVDCHQRHG